jgi:hypothetical protein
VLRAVPGQSAAQADRSGPLRRYGSPFSTNAYSCVGGELTARPEDYMAAIDTACNGTRNPIRPTDSGEEG